jgi:hypothetical protein
VPHQPVTIGPWQYAVSGLAVALGLTLTWGARVDHLRGAHKAAREQMARDYTDAQRRAKAAFEAQIAAFQTQNRRLNDATQKQSDHLRIVYRDRVIRLPAASAACTAGSADMPTTRDAASSYRSGGDTVLLERADALICAANTARLEAGREWALGWQQSQLHETTVIAD